MKDSLKQIVDDWVAENSDLTCYTQLSSYESLAAYVQRKTIEKCVNVVLDTKCCPGGPKLSVKNIMKEFE